ncbi:MAG: histidinol dehydrogenase, partial [Pannonibacter indicus]
MAIRLSTADADFETRFKDLLSGKREVSEDVDQVVRTILDDVRARGDAAVVEYTNRFDRVSVSSIAELRVTAEEIEAATAAVEPATLDALKLARDRIHSHHARQMPKDDRYTDALGVELGSRWTAVEAVGL